MKKALLLPLLCIPLCLFAQQAFYNGYSPAATTAPTAARVTQGGATGINRTTGAVQHYVPLYSISQNGITWDTGLQYHYSGLQVMQEPSVIGLGWDLAATGMVSREVRGLPDDHPKGYYGSENIRQQFHLDKYYDLKPIGDLNNQTGDKYLETDNKKMIKEHHAYLLAQGMADGEPDVFRVSAGRLNVAFKLDENLEPVLLSHHNVKINFTWDRIEVTDSEGVVYVFEDKEVFTPVPEDDIFGVDIQGNPVTLPIETNYPYTRSWYLSSIQPPNTTREIAFTYQNHLYKTKAFLPKIYSYKGKQAEFLVDLEYKPRGIVTIGTPPDPELRDGQDPYVYSHTRLDVDITKPVLTRIDFAEGSLHFNTVAVPSGVHPQYSGAVLKDFNNVTINTYNFTTTGNRKLFTELQINNEFAYGFEYYHQNDPSAIPIYEHVNDSVASQMDYWGYYTGKQVSYNVMESSDGYDPVFNSTLSGALKKIQFKTGGYSEITYQPNSLPRKIDYTPHPNDSWDFNPDFELSATGGNASGGPIEKAITRTFNSNTNITLNHYGKIAKYGARMKLRILKHGIQQNYTPYYYEPSSTFAPQLYVDIIGDDESGTEGETQFETSHNRTLTITPGTYTFYLWTQEGSEASIAVDYQNTTQAYRTESYDRPYGGIRVHRIKSVAPDTEQYTLKEFNYTNNQLLGSGKPYSVLLDLPKEEFHRETSTDLQNFKYPFYVENRGVPMYYSQVSESVISNDPQSQEQNGKTVYTFEDPNYFASELDFRVKEYYDRMPKGNIESGLRISTVSNYKFTDNFDQPGTKEQLISTQTYEYQPVAVNADLYGNSLEDRYPYGIKVISKKGVKRDMHYPDWILQQFQLGLIGDPAPVVLQDFDDKYINGTQAEFETYARTLLTATNTLPNSMVGAQLRYMATGVTDIAAEHRPGWQYTSVWSEEIKHEYYTVLEYKDINIQHLRTRVTTQTYSDQEPGIYATTAQEYVYDDNNQLTEQRTTNSKGEVQTVQYYYPYHPQATNNTLVTDNRIASPVKTETYHQGVKQSTAVVNFDTWGTSYLPSTLQSAKEDTPLKDQTIYYDYDDYGNPLETSAKNGIHTIIVWGYDHTAPIAVIANATYTNMPADVQALITAAQTASVNDTDDATEEQLRTALKQLREHSYFANSQVQTYTYDPLIGMTSQTDPRGYTMYYEYDDQHRLLFVKDKDRNIISENQYQYSNN